MDEFSGYMMAGLFFFAFAITLAENKHVRVRFVTDRLPPSIRRWLYVITEAIAIVYLGILTWYGWSLVHNSYTRNVLSETAFLTPIWIPQLTYAIGMTIFMLALMVILVKTTAKLFAKKTPP